LARGKNSLFKPLGGLATGIVEGISPLTLDKYNTCIVKR
jgi:hypothetical protein